MKHFPSIEKLDTGILSILELVSSPSDLFLTFGLIASIANVLTKRSVLVILRAELDEQGKNI